MITRTIWKSISASFLISIGVAVLLSALYIGPILFALGLLTICTLNLNLFTGKCGYCSNPKVKKQLPIILITNLISGYLFGLLLSISNPHFIPTAIEKIEKWSWSFESFLQAFFCGAIMYLCVELYKRKEKLGILYGVPIFIFCGFQHCIANIIILGVARTFNPIILLHIIGNFIGANFIAIVLKKGTEL